MLYAGAFLVELQPVACSTTTDQLFRPIADHGRVERLLLPFLCVGQFARRLPPGCIRAALDNVAPAQPVAAFPLFFGQFQPLARSTIFDRLFRPTECHSRFERTLLPPVLPIEYTWIVSERF